MLQAFPIESYKFSDNQYRDITNFTLSVIIANLNLSKRVIYKPYSVFDTDTPETVSNAIYGQPNYWWTILIVNTMINPFSHWIRNNYLIDEHPKAEEILYFYNNRNGRIQDDLEEMKYREMVKNKEQLPQYINAMTRRNYERKKNEQNEQIFVIDPAYIEEFVSEYEALLKNVRNDERRYKITY